MALEVCGDHAVWDGNSRYSGGAKGHRQRRNSTDSFHGGGQSGVGGVQSMKIIVSFLRCGESWSIERRLEVDAIEQAKRVTVVWMISKEETTA